MNPLKLLWNLALDLLVILIKLLFAVFALTVLISVIPFILIFEEKNKIEEAVRLTLYAYETVKDVWKVGV